MMTKDDVLFLRAELAAKIATYLGYEARGQLTEAERDRLEGLRAMDGPMEKSIQRMSDVEAGLRLRLPPAEEAEYQRQLGFSGPAVLRLARNLQRAAFGGKRTYPEGDMWDPAPVYLRQAHALKGDAELGPETAALMGWVVN